MKTLNRLLIFLAIILIFIFGALLFPRSTAPAKTADQKVGGGITVNTYKCHTATTTPEFMTTSTATSSCIVLDLDNAKKVDLRFALKASTTNSVLHRKVFVTNDDAGPTRNWYEITGSAASWTPANSVASTSYMNFPLTDLSAKAIKVDYSVGGANAGVYLEAARQNNLY
ncbi:MAG: hypothetical protein WCW77_00515 [Patescibacteria group bacterium]|jgi:hypothetical protein